MTGELLRTNNAHSNALEASRVAHSGRCLLFGFTAFNTNAAAQVVQLHDADKLPADGAVPCFPFSVAASGDRWFGYWPPRYMERGIVLCNSSTVATKTIGAADCFFDVQFLPLDDAD